VGGQWFLLDGKAMPGVVGRAGSEWWWGHLETSLLMTTEDAPNLDTPFLGSQFGGYVAVAPLHLERVEAHAGVGGDFYWLWAVHGDEWHVGLSLRASGHFWMTNQLGVFVTLRGYPVSTQGLELGTTRDGDDRLPILASLGLEWRPE
jgi:hypothetical protein